MKKIIISSVVIVFLTVGFVASGPFIALSKLEQAIDTENKSLLYETVDFSLLKINLKKQFNDYVNGNEQGNSPLDGLLSSITSIFIENAVDALVTPEGFISMMQGSSLAYNPKEGSVGNKPEKKPVRDVFEGATYSLDGINKFSVWVQNKQGEKSQFIFYRYGVTWKLVNVVLPLDTPGQSF